MRKSKDLYQREVYTLVNSHSVHWPGDRSASSSGNRTYPNGSTCGRLAITNLAEALYEASKEATGSHLCDRKLSARYTAEFNRRYGSRVRALTEYHVGKYGPDPDFIIITSCRTSNASSHRQVRDHALAMNRFESALHDLELQFGPEGGILSR